MFNRQNQVERSGGREKRRDWSNELAQVGKDPQKSFEKKTLGSQAWLSRGYECGSLRVRTVGLYAEVSLV